MDELDEGILRCVISNSRSTYAEIGEATSLSASAVKRRLDRLVASGAIKGFTAIVDTKVMSWRTEAYVEVYCRGNPAPEKLQASLEKIPEVVEACTVTGPADAILHILARDTSHLEQIVQRVRQASTVERTESVIVLSRLVDRPRQ